MLCLHSQRIAAIGLRLNMRCCM